VWLVHKHQCALVSCSRRRCRREGEGQFAKLQWRGQGPLATPWPPWWQHVEVAGVLWLQQMPAD
jgi:hypothetical protein